MNKKLFALTLSFACVGIASADVNSKVNLGQIIIDPYEMTTLPRRTIEIISDSTICFGGQQFSHRHGNALYSIYDSEGGCILPSTPVCEDGVVHIDEIDLSSVGTYQLKIVATEDCVLQLTTGSFYDVPQKEEIPLSSSVTYGLDIVVEDDEE